LPPLKLAPLTKSKGGIKNMAKVVNFTDVYQIAITIKQSDDTLESLDLIYGLVDSEEVKWATKFWKILPEELTAGEKAFITTLVTAAKNKVKVREGI
jgi:hypothetical protein